MRDADTIWLSALEKRNRDEPGPTKSNEPHNIMINDHSSIKKENKQIFINDSDLWALEQAPIPPPLRGGDAYSSVATLKGTKQNNKKKKVKRTFFLCLIKISGSSIITNTTHTKKLFSRSDEFWIRNLEVFIMTKLALFEVHVIPRDEFWIRNLEVFIMTKLALFEVHVIPRYGFVESRTRSREGAWECLMEGLFHFPWEAGSDRTEEEAEIRIRTEVFDVLGLRLK
ncbi:hypothetical protein L484_020319 [Morus notabilis]|uniref:Uncharacterized protein n=1 Tax=Morus notabilis TaxID=981085 RepID=W9QS14_9ROSA|nr:hypothetical protein L484_020319 [Morus notabilis]